MSLTVRLGLVAILIGAPAQQPVLPDVPATTPAPQDPRDAAAQGKPLAATTSLVPHPKDPLAQPFQTPEVTQPKGDTGAARNAQPPASNPRIVCGLKVFGPDASELPKIRVFTSDASVDYSIRRKAPPVCQQ